MQKEIMKSLESKKNSIGVHNFSTSEPNSGTFVPKPVLQKKYDEETASSRSKMS